MRALRSKREGGDALRRALRPVDRRRRGQSGEAPRLVLVRERARRRSQCGRVPSASRATSRGGTTATGLTTPTSRSSSARSRSRSCTGTRGKVRPAGVVYTRPVDRGGCLADRREGHPRARRSSGASRRVPSGWNVFLLAPGPARASPLAGAASGGPASPVELTFSGDVDEAPRRRRTRRGSPSREPGRRHRTARCRGRGGAGHKQASGSRRRSLPTFSSSACALRPAALAVSGRCADERRRRARALAARLVVGRRHAALGRADVPGARTAGRLDRRDPDRCRQRAEARGVGLAFAAYALLLDHDRLIPAARFARRSALAVALATRPRADARA